MAQVTIYLDPKTAAKAKAAARKAGLSQSRWISDLIRRHTELEWPRAIQRLAGSWPGFPRSEEIRADLGEDAPRPSVE